MRTFPFLQVIWSVKKKKLFYSITTLLDLLSPLSVTSTNSEILIEIN